MAHPVICEQCGATYDGDTRQACPTCGADVPMQTGLDAGAQGQRGDVVICEACNTR